MATIRWDGSLDKGITFTSNDSVMEEVELGYINRNLTRLALNSSNLFDIGDRVVVSCPDKWWCDGKSGQILSWRSVEPGEYYYNVIFDDRTLGRVSFKESLLRKEIPNEGRFNMSKPKWTLGDKVIYVGNNDIAHNRHGVITGLTMDLNTYTPRYKFSWLEGGASGDYWRTYEVSYCKDTDFIPDMPVVPYTDYTSRYIASDTYATFTFMSNLHIYNMEISKVIFNPPATIVFWKDGEKTIVKCGEGDIFDQEKGLAMAICKRLFGSNKSGSDYYDEFSDIFDAMKSDDPEKAIAMKLIEKKKGKKYFKDICKKYCSDPKPVEEEPKKDNNPCTDCPDRKKGCLTNCEKMQAFVNDIQDTEKSPEPIEPGYFVRHAEERKNKPKAHVSTPEKKDIPMVPMSIANFVEKFDATMFPSNFLAFCKKNNLYFFIVDKIKGGMKAIDPYTTNWQQVTRYLKSGVMESCMKMKDHNINNSFLAVDMDRALFAKLPVELRGENRKEKDLYDKSRKA